MNPAQPGDATSSVSLYSSPIYKLIVGPDRKVFTAHQAILEKSYWFLSCSRFVEGQTLEICLPDDRPEHMEKIIAWLYTDQLEYHRPRITSDDSTPALTDLVSLYIVAHKYFVKGLQTKICGMFEKHFNLQGIDTAFAHHTFFELLRAAGLNNSDHCELTKLLLGKLATDLRRYGWDQYLQEVDPGLAEELMEDSVMMLKLVARLADSNSNLDHSLRNRKKLKRSFNQSWEESTHQVVTIN